jgi:hypothetical protein
MESVVKVGDYGTAGGSVMESAVKAAQDWPRRHLSNLLLTDYQQFFCLFVFSEFCHLTSQLLEECWNENSHPASSSLGRSSLYQMSRTYVRISEHLS